MENKSGLMGHLPYGAVDEKHRSRWARGLALLFLLGLPLLPAGAQEVNADLESLRKKKIEILEKLIVPVEQCVRRQDTEHVAFHGCVDWHSAVHGTWALVKYTQLTGNDRFVPLIEKILSAEKVAAELRLLQERSRFEMPYGRAWFLRLVLDYRLTFQSSRLDPAGDWIANSLVRHYRENPPDPFAREYQNPSWALLNLYDYGKATGKRTMVAFVEGLIERKFQKLDGPCPLENDYEIWPDFFSVCLNWANLMARVHKGVRLQRWLKRFLPTDACFRPVVSARSAHHKGINFNRAWALWRIYKTTGEKRFLRSFLSHFRQEYQKKEWWRGDYHEVSHWVPQFGIFALAGLWEGK